MQTQTCEVLGRGWGREGGFGEAKTILPFTFLKCVQRLHIFPGLTVIYLTVTQFTVVMIKDHKFGLFS